MRATLGLACFTFAFWAIWTAIAIAPDMTFPATEAEWLAAILLVTGGVSKLAGHVLLWPAARQA